MTYLGSPAQLADVRASRFLAQRSVISGTIAASLPGYTEPARPIARGSAFVVPTRDPTRASTAASLVAMLMAAENQGAWTRAANLLPTRQAAFDHWYPPIVHCIYCQELGG
jgi:ABC-type glycerol-3-phosphate transport system substrate-binding protein